MMNAQFPVALEVRAEDPVFRDVLPEPPEFALPPPALLAEERGPARGKIIDQVDERETVVAVPRRFAQVLEKIVPLRLVDPGGRDDALVADDPGVRAAKDVDPAPVAEFDEERFLE